MKNIKEIENEIDDLIINNLQYTRGHRVVGIRSTNLRDELLTLFQQSIDTAGREERERIIKKIKNMKSDYYNEDYNLTISEVISELKK
jgi:hypothetical protein